MSLHHVGDEVAALRALRDVLASHGLLVIAEFGDVPTRVLPDDLDVGRPGLADRVERASGSWYAAMRAGLDGSVPSRDVPTMVAAAGLDVVGARLVRERFDAPLPAAARQVVLGQVRRAREQLADRLDADDLAALDVLGDADDPRGVQHRDDVALDASRQIVLARVPG
jgi:hypothetical protein